MNKIDNELLPKVSGRLAAPISEKKKSRALGPALKIVSTLLSPKVRIIVA
jgi:hypothetical protein